jgi:hypothetical protein
VSLFYHLVDGADKIQVTALTERKLTNLIAKALCKRAGL